MVGHGGLGGAYRAGGSVGRGCQRSVSFWSRQQAARGGAPPSGALGFVRRPPTHQPAADDDDLLRHGCSPRATARGRPSFWHPKTARHTGGGWEVSAVPRVLHRCKYSACVCQPFCRVLRSPATRGPAFSPRSGPCASSGPRAGRGCPRAQQSVPPVRFHECHVPRTPEAPILVIPRLGIRHPSLARGPPCGWGSGRTRFCRSAPAGPHSPRVSAPCGDGECSSGRFVSITVVSSLEMN